MPSTVRHSLLNAASTVVSMAAGLVVTVLVARILGPSGSGLVAFALWAAMSLSALTDRGVPQTVLRYVSALSLEEEKRLLIGAAYRHFLTLPLVAFVVVASIALWLPHTALLGSPLDTGLGFAGAVLFMFYAFSAFSIAAARGRGDFVTPAVNSAIGSLLQLPLVVIGAMSFGVTGAVVAVSMRYLPQVLQLPRLVDRRAARSTAALTPEMRAYGRDMWISDLVNIVALTRIEYLVLGIFLTSADMGLFAVAIVFAGLVEQLAMQLSSPLVVAFSRASEDEPQNESSVDKANAPWQPLIVFSVLVLPVAFGGAALMPELLPLVFGEAFYEARLPGMVLLAASASTGLAVVPWAYLAAIGEGRLLMRITLGLGGFTVVTLCAAVAFGGVEGAAWSRLFTETVSLFVLLVAAWRHHQFSAMVAALGRVAIAALFSGISAYAVIATIASPVGIAPAVVVGALCYGAALRLLKALPADAILPGAQALSQRLPGLPGRLLLSTVRLITHC